ncbi:MAG TPA: apolipoprotein N-acyltransferase [Longimicrobiales bacterium]|nr:apolipoprotein N-acyltransferase [Longimicrobiales bacterium]
MKLLPPRGERLLPLLAGLLLAVSFPPFGLLVPPFVALTPLLVFIETRGADAEGRWAAARGGMLAGLVYFGILLYWLIVALIFYSKLAIAAYALTVLILGIFTATFASGVHYLRMRRIAPLWLVAPLLWTTLEWVQGNLGDVAFPWLGLGSALAPYPLLAGGADLVGARGMTFVVALVAALAAEAVLRAGRNRPVLSPILAAAGIVLLMFGYGFARARTLELVPAARVAVVQPNIPEDLKLDRDIGIDSSMVALTNLTARLAGTDVDLVVWPEVAIPAVLTSPYSRAMRETVQRMSALVDAPIVVGAYEPIDAGEDRAFLNAALVMDPQGFRPDVYGKRHLVPIVERVPFIDPAILERITGDLAYFGGLGRGPTTPLFEAAGARFGILICYESIFAGLSRTYRRAGADFLVNMTNDAWYGREPWYARTSALWQHPAHLTMRAIEQRVGVARAANTGISMFVDPIGRTYERTELFEPDVRVATVYTTDAVTLFSRWGDWLATLAAAVSGVLLIVAWRRKTTGGLATG